MGMGCRGIWRLERGSLLNAKQITIISLILLVAVGSFLFATHIELKPSPTSLQTVLSDVQRLQVLDRLGRPLSVSYQNRWNLYDALPLYEIPSLLQEAFVVSEDKRFFEHRGDDWRARLHAVWQNIKSFSKVRGASTITEQVIRLLHPRPRSLWSRWIEGWEARSLEKKVSKADILEFYLNQVSYAANRRGVVQAARYYFNRELSTLSPKEMLSLVVLVRAPSRLDPYRHPERLEPLVVHLAKKLVVRHILPQERYQSLLQEQLTFEKAELPVDSSHFVTYVRQNVRPESARPEGLHTTLNATLQAWIQDRLDRSLGRLRTYKVYNGAALVVDYHTDEILAWVVAGTKDENVPGRFIDAVTTPRQPGSTLKPFLYAMALESGWSPATVIPDTPADEVIGHGLHSYRNYSGRFYGPVTLRQALGNSLNIPAIRTIRFVGVHGFLARLQRLGFESLKQSADYYGDGLVLGNGEVSLFELVQAYSTLARRGVFRPLKFLSYENLPRSPRQVFSPEISSLIANILSDPNARLLEFGRRGILDFPVQTAVKTGTSNDHRDTWSIGFNDRYVVGVWMGNLDQNPTQGLTGSRGPALLLRSIFARLNQNRETRALYLSPKLIQRSVCVDSIVSPPCQTRMEWFLPGQEPERIAKTPKEKPIQIFKPTPGLHLARDPRIPDEDEVFEFQIIGLNPKDCVEWWLNDRLIAKTNGGRYLWPLKKGTHKLRASVLRDQKVLKVTDEVAFFVW